MHSQTLTYSRTARLRDILSNLEVMSGEGGLSTYELAECHFVAQPTIRRDIQRLRQQGHNILSEDGRYRLVLAPEPALA